MKDEIPELESWNYHSGPGFDLMDFTPEQKAKLMSVPWKPFLQRELIVLLVATGLSGLFIGMAIGAAIS